MEIIDYSNEYKETPFLVKHSEMFPKKIFCVIAGATDCGKTMLLSNLLRKENTLDFRDVYIYCPTVH